MAASRVQIILATSDANPANFVTNTFCIEHGVHPDGDEVKAAFKAAYDVIGSSYLSQQIAQNGHWIKLVDAIGTAPLYPWYESAWSLASAPSGTPLPPEVALCLSFQGERLSGQEQRRRRGRVYFGPLGNAVVSTNARPAAGFVQDLEDFAIELASELAGLTQPGVLWSVWSTTDTESVAITDGWVDDEFDTQRRRGRAYTTRNTWAI